MRHRDRKLNLGNRGRANERLKIGLDGLDSDGSESAATKREQQYADGREKARKSPAHADASMPQLVMFLDTGTPRVEFAADAA
jgi:hypothetical protein